MNTDEITFDVAYWVRVPKAVTLTLTELAELSGYAPAELLAMADGLTGEIEDLDPAAVAAVAASLDTTVSSEELETAEIDGITITNTSD